MAHIMEINLSKKNKQKKTKQLKGIWLSHLPILWGCKQNERRDSLRYQEDNKGSGRRSSEGGLDVDVGGNMRINADSSGWEQRICQGSVQLYQSVNSHDYDENFSAHCVLLIGFLLWASFPDSGTTDAEAIKFFGRGHKSRCILSVGVMSEHARPVPDWNMYNNGGVHRRQQQWLLQHNKRSNFWWE